MPLSADQIRYFEKHFLTYKDLDKLKPPDWLIYNRIPSRGISFLIGKDGVCKTTTAVSMACAIASGMEWAGLPTRHGKVIYIAAEDANGTAPKFKAWCKHHNIADMPEFLLFNDSIELNAYDFTLNMVEYITTTYGKDDIKLIIVDTLALCTPGVNENNKHEMDEVIKSLYKFWRTFRCAILVIHHTGAGSERLRGSTSMDGISSATLKVEQVDERIGISDGKRRYGPAQDTLYLDKVTVPMGYLDEAGLEKEELVLTKAQNQVQHVPGVLTQRQKQALSIIYSTQDHSMQQSSLMHLMGVGKSNMTNIIKPMVDSGFLESKKMGRSITLTVASRGELLLADHGYIENTNVFDLDEMSNYLGLSNNGSSP